MKNINIILIFCWFSTGIILYETMLFKIQWLVSTAKNQSNLTFILEVPEEKVIKYICGKYSIAVFSISEYKENIQSFGKAYFRFLYEKQEYTLYSNFDKAKDLFSTFREAWFNITYINNLLKPLPDVDVPRVLEKLNSDYANLNKPQDIKDKSYIQQFTNMIVEQWNVQLSVVKKAAAKTIEESEQVLNNLSPEQKIKPQNVKVRNAVEELKRVKLGSNIVKIRDQISLVYQLMEKIELEYLEEQKEIEVKIIEWSTVTYLDIVSERDKYKKSINLQKAKAKGGWISYYAVFWTLWLYQKLIWKELHSRFKNVIVVIDTLYNTLILFIMMTTVWLVLFQLFNSIAFGGSFFTESFINLGLMWICSALLMKIKKPHLVNLLITWPFCAILYFVLHKIIYVNFWL